MEKDRSHLTIVNESYSGSHDCEFLPLPYYNWDQRPDTLPLDVDECATAIHLSDGDVLEAAALLKVPIIRLNRIIRHNPRLQRILEEALGVSLVRAAHVPLATLRDPNADRRQLEWASTKLLQSRLAQGHLLSPAPAAGIASNVVVDKRIVVLWGNGEKIAEIGPVGVDSGVDSNHADLHENKESPEATD